MSKHCILGSGHYLWEGGLGNGRGGKRSFTLINRGGQKSFNTEKGGGSYKFFNLNTMSRVLISIIINSNKEDSQNAISNDLETQNFQNFPARRQPW